MKTSHRRRRTARKLILPLLAVGTMMLMNYLHSGASQPTTASLAYSR